MFMTGVAKLKSSMQISQRSYYNRDRYLKFYPPEVFLIGNQMSIFSQHLVNNLIFCAFYFTYLWRGWKEFFLLWYLMVFIANNLGRCFYSLISVLHRHGGHPVVLLTAIQFVLIGSNGFFNFLTYGNGLIRFLAYINPLYYVFTGSLLILYEDNKALGGCDLGQEFSGQCYPLDLQKLPIKSLTLIFIIVSLQLLVTFWVQSILIRIVDYMERK